MARRKNQPAETPATGQEEKVMKKPTQEEVQKAEHNIQQGRGTAVDIITKVVDIMNSTPAEKKETKKASNKKAENMARIEENNLILYVVKQTVTTTEV